MARKDIKRSSLEELKALRARGKTRTRADAPVREIEEDFWEHAHVVMPGSGKTSVHLRVDSDVLEWFRKRSEEHTSELESRLHLVCRLLLEKKKKPQTSTTT